MKKKKSVERQKDPKELLEEFLQKEGFVINANPVFTPTNHGTFELAVRISVGKK